MKPSSILETILYSSDIEQAAWFYHQVLGLDMPGGMSELMTCFHIDDNHVLLIFDPSKSDKPGRGVPSHGPRGAGHIALRIEESQYDSWKKQLSTFGVGIEQEVDWATEESFRPGRSIYCRDPYGNSVELITANIWPEFSPNKD
ncbi:MAG: VOC family protein [Phycisphaerales bacterium]|nr:VOC family protein [Phycisphaerales bacterium]